MNISITFNDTKITPLRYGGGTNEHTIPCQKMEYVSSRNVLQIAFSPSDLLEKSVKMVISNRKIRGYGDSPQKYVEIPTNEVERASVRTDMR